MGSLFPIKKEYPLWYFNKRGDSDKQFVLDRMFFIPDELKEQVSDKYENIYRDNKPDFRGRANKYLHNEAIKHKEKSKKLNAPTLKKDI